MSNDLSKSSQLLNDMPRGVTSRFLSEQSAPQARWITPEEILNYDALHYDPHNPGGKILFGAIGDQLIGIDDNRHIVTMAGSRAGKSITAIANFFFYPGSILCTDPKGELANITAQHRLKLGQKVFILDPYKIVNEDLTGFRSSFNPLSSLKLTNKNIIEDALLITDAMVMSSGNEKDPHWNESASHFIMGLILYIATSPSIKNEDRHLGNVRACINRALASIKKDGKEVIILATEILQGTDELRSLSYGELADVIEGAITGFYDKGDDELGSVLSTVRRHTQFLDFFAMKEILEGHDFDLDDLKRDPAGISIYLVLPATKMGLCNRWLRLFINQLLEAMEREKTIPKYPVLVCLDEFPVLGFMKQLQDAAGQIASFSVRLWIIMQDWGQGKALYGERFESFIANAGIFQAFGNVDNATTEHISKRLGQTIVESVDAPSMSTKTEETMIAPKTTKQLYPLLHPDEVAKSFSRNDPLRRQLILWAGYDPMIIQRIEYFDKESPIRKYL